MNQITRIMALSALMVSASAWADADYPSLGCKSRNQVIISSLKGGALNLSMYTALYWLTQDHELPNFRSHPLLPAIATIAGAAVGGLWTYFYLPESEFTFAKRGLIQLAENNNDLLELIMVNDSAQLVDYLKKHFFKEALPLYTAFNTCNKMYKNLDTYQNSLQKVLESDRTELYEESQELLIIIDIYQELLRMALKTIREDANFLNECNTGALQEMQHAQEAAAQAAQTAVFVQMTKPNVIHCYK